MQRLDGTLLHSATDLVAFLDCEHRTALDLAHVDVPAETAPDDDHAELIQRKGHEHERAYLEHLRSIHCNVAVVESDRRKSRADDLAARVAQTLTAMRRGADIVYQATFRDGPLLGHADFLRRVDGPSALGDWHYEVIDTKLARTPKAKFVVQLAFYTELLRRAQGRAPLLTWVVTGDAARTEHPFRVADSAHYVAHQLGRYLARVEGGGAATYPDPCEACEQCRWRVRCEQQRLDDDHLCQVADIRRQTTRRLEAAGVGTMTALADLPDGTAIPKVQPETLTRLRTQARLQHLARLDGQRRHELLDPDPDGRLGLHRLPPPDPHDLYFDMEGDPLEPDGLEGPGRIVFAIDTSGSMSSALLAQAFGEVESLRRTFPCELTLVQCDAQVQDVRHFEAEDPAELRQDLTVVGRGGTDFRPLFERVAKDPARNHGTSPPLIFVSDGYGTFPKHPPLIPVIWLMPRGSNHDAAARYGQIVEID